MSTEYAFEKKNKTKFGKIIEVGIFPTAECICNLSSNTAKLTFLTYGAATNFSGFVSKKIIVSLRFCAEKKNSITSIWYSLEDMKYKFIFNLLPKAEIFSEQCFVKISKQSFMQIINF